MFQLVKTTFKFFKKDNFKFPDDINAPIGHVVLQWNAVQTVVFLMYLGFRGLPLKEAEEEFYNSKPDRKQIDMTRKLGISALAANPAKKDKFVALFDRIIEEKEGRNLVAHHTLAIDDLGYWIVIHQKSSQSKKFYDQYGKRMEEIRLTAETLLGDLLEAFHDYFYEQFSDEGKCALSKLTKRLENGPDDGAPQRSFGYGW